MIKKRGFTFAEVLVTMIIIGVVATMTIPKLIQSHKKHVTEVRLKQTYSILSQAVQRAQVEYGDIETWNFSASTNNFVDTYLIKSFKNFEKVNAPAIYNDMASNSNYGYSYSTYDIRLHNGTIISFYRRYVTTGYYLLLIIVDTNGVNKPNKLGIDRFYFHLVPSARSYYNTGSGNISYNIPHGGLYYDGYGMELDELKNNTYRGCGKNDWTESRSTQGAHCIALIVRNNWKIPDDYPLKF